jgi:NTP pyrophosphatase (non-canonical NTP hydrolase)
LTDVFIYVLNLAGCLGVDLLAEYLKKRDKNVARFAKAQPNGARL